MVSAALVLAMVAPPQAIDGWLAKTAEDRAALSIPAPEFDRILTETGHKGASLGYTADQMAGFPQNPYLLRLVANAFRDVRHVPEYAGLLSDNLLQSAPRADQLGYLGWNQLDVRAGRDWPVPKGPEDWGAPWIPASATLEEAANLAFLRVGGEGKLPSLSDPITRFILRILVAAEASAPFLNQAVPPEFKLGSRDDFWRLAIKPYFGEANDDNILVPDRASYDLQRRFDPAYAAFGAARFLRGVHAAIDEFPAGRLGMFTAQPIRFKTSLGDFVIGSSGDDVYDEGAFAILELGGNDLYRGPAATPLKSGQPISFIFDVSGNDRYGRADAQTNVACGLGGIGLLIDRAGNDQYLAQDAGIGFGLFGTGILLDQAGNDLYLLSKTMGIGAAYFGVGIVSDLDGKDQYRSTALSMGFGGTFGLGALIESSGDDDYRTADDGNPSVAWGGKTVSLSLGCGYGRRADFGDGQLQGGGIGVIVDGRGNDTYHSSIFTMGSGYWWGFGIMEDRAGNDTYRCTHYSIGSGAHFALGSFVDLAGDDRYNDRPDAVERWGAIGRDGSIATCFDGGGNDVWGNVTAGHADLNSIALFWDREGNDVHKRMQPFDPKAFGNRPYGSAVPYAPFRNFRDRMKSAGIYLDSTGKDVYPSGMTAAEGKMWRLNTGPNEFGFGWDR